MTLIFTQILMIATLRLANMEHASTASMDTTAIAIADIVATTVAQVPIGRHIE